MVGLEVRAVEVAVDVPVPAALFVAADTLDAAVMEVPVEVVKTLLVPADIALAMKVAIMKNVPVLKTIMIL